MMLLFSTNAQTTSSAIGEVNDTVKICAGQSVSLISKLSQHVAYDFENGLPNGFTLNGGNIVDSICNNPAPSNVAWLDFYPYTSHPKQLYLDDSNIYRVDFDIKLSNFNDICVNPFTSSANNQAVQFGMLQTYTTIGGSILVSGNATCTGAQYNWQRMSKTTVIPALRIIWYHGNSNDSPGSWGIDNVDTWKYIKYDSTSWRCLEFPNFTLNKDTTVLLPGQAGTTIHMIATSYKDGIEYLSTDTLKVVTNILPAPISYGITGNQSICANTSETYVVHSQYVDTYQWIKPSSFVGTSTDSIINLTFGNTISAATQKIIVKLFNACTSTADTILVTKRATVNVSICYVEYDIPSNKNKIVWTSATNPLIDSIFVYREISSQFVKIGTISYGMHEFVDSTSNPPVQSYNYKISATNLCNKEGNQSTNHKTISLQPISSGGIYYFSWTPYQGLSFNDYTIYGLDASNNSYAVASVNSNQFTYNYINPNPMYVSYYVGIDVTDCFTKANVRIKSNYILSPTVGINENQNTILKMYPNPVTHILNIDFLNNNKENHICILNNIGQIVFETVCTEKISIDTKHFHAGIYFIKLSNNESKYFIKIK